MGSSRLFLGMEFVDPSRVRRLPLEVFFLLLVNDPFVGLLFIGFLDSTRVGKTFGLLLLPRRGVVFSYYVPWNVLIFCEFFRFTVPLLDLLPETLD